ncbi:MAG: ATP-binding cassette domain-containing protein [Betaproteobacteria bacterium]|nr:MAG: ATP-binding cassette domain-containing protein [Betaproteobacteria bacterium]
MRKRKLDTGAAAEGAFLRVENIHLRFGGVRAITGVGFHVNRGEISSIIGPNGAGKSSMLNIINGVYRPQTGTVTFLGRTHHHMRPHEAAEQGIARTFQNIALFKGMTVLDNIMTGRNLKMKTNFVLQAVFWGPARREELENRHKVEEVIDFLEIQHIRKVRVGRVGLFADRPLLASLGTSAIVAAWVTVLSVAVGAANAFLLERVRFRGKSLLALAMLAPLVIPGVILGISILAFASRLAQFADDFVGVELEFLRPGLPLVVIGQFSYIVSIATLMIAARLKRFDTTLEEAALNLGASRAGVLRTITLPYLQPALVGAGAIAFLMSFENFNTTLMLVGSDPPLTVMMYGRMREGASPVLNAVSLFLMIASALLALALLQRPDARQD